MRSVFYKISRIYHTIKFLKFIQIYGRLVLYLRKPHPNFSKPPDIRNLKISHWKPLILRANQIISNHTIEILNRKESLLNNNLWDNPEVDRLWLYNLHYFDFINSVSGSEQIELCNMLIHRWINENPPISGVGWEFYPTSLRIVNWVKWVLTGNKLTQKMTYSLAIQTRYLYEHPETHLLGNHLLANAKALLFSGLFFNGAESDQWFKKGMKIYKTQLSEQVLEDGAHFELSPMYHCIILEDLLDIVNLFINYNYCVPSNWIDICGKMLTWLSHMCHPDGEIPFFNDAAFGIASTFHEIFQYHQRIFPFGKIIKKQGAVHHRESGYVRVEKGEIFLLADVGDIGPSYQPGHAHADTLSFELSYRNQRIIVNSGTSTYNESDERLRQRGTKAHSTLTINDRDSSQVWKSFRVAQRARILNSALCLSEGRITIEGSHDGYYSSYKIIHKRIWQIEKNLVLIKDLVDGSGVHKLQLNFHMYPTIKIVQENSKKISLFTQDNVFLGVLKLSIEAVIENTTFHPMFNRILDNKTIVAMIQNRLPLMLSTQIEFEN